MDDFSFSEQSTVREVVARHPQARAVFERHGIDYCCGGARSLASAAAEQSLAPARLLEEIARAAAAPPPAGDEGRDWSDASAAELTGYIEQRHHAFMHGELPRVEALLGRVVEAHGLRHGRTLAALQNFYGALDAALTHHLYTEELVVFPLIRALEARRGAERRAAPPSLLREHLEHLAGEHETAGRDLARMRAVTDGYALPESACESFRALYDALQAMEADLKQHIHLENNVLFPKAQELI